MSEKGVSVLRFYLLLTLTGLFLQTGCKSDVKEKAVTLDDISTTSTHRYSESADTEKKSIELPESPLIRRLGDTLLQGNQWKKWDTVLFADRFGPVVSEKWIAISPADSISIQHYRFKDSLRTKNAFFNLLDCFGKNCTSYVIGGNIRIPHRTALYYVGEKDMFLIESSHALRTEKVNFILSPDEKKRYWIYMVTIPLKGKTTWKSVQADHETLITERHEDS